MSNYDVTVVGAAAAAAVRPRLCCCCWGWRSLNEPTSCIKRTNERTGLLKEAGIMIIKGLGLWYASVPLLLLTHTTSSKIPSLLLLLLLRGYVQGIFFFLLLKGGNPLSLYYSFASRFVRSLSLSSHTRMQMPFDSVYKKRRERCKMLSFFFPS